MIPNELIEAVKIARSCKDHKTFRFGCLAKRRDGAYVRSTNGIYLTKGFVVTKFGQKIPEGHAEVRVLRKCDAGSTIWVARVKADGSWGSAKPCETCRAAIKNRRVHKVVYTLGPNEYGIWFPMLKTEPN